MHDDPEVWRNGSSRSIKAASLAVNSGHSLNLDHHNESDAPLSHLLQFDD
jgi:hypothetical protein